MDCKEYREHLDIDGHGDTPGMQAHAAVCPDCTAIAARLNQAFLAYTLPDAVSSFDLVPRIRDLIPLLPGPRRVMPIKNWLLGGLAILGSMIVLPMMGGYRFMHATYGSDFTLSLFLVLGSIFSLYAGLFVASHLDELSKRLNLPTTTVQIQR